MRTAMERAHSTLVSPASLRHIDHLSASPNDAVSILPELLQTNSLSPVMQEEQWRGADIQWQQGCRRGVDKTATE